MSKATKKSAAFLQALTPPAAPPAPANTSEPTAPKLVRTASRTGLKHIGGYFDRADVEKIAVLRAGLGLDNSQLIKLAIDELYRNHEAKPAFGDA